MAQIEVILPKMGESVAEATITTWLKSEGDTVEAEEAIVEIATDKVDSEVPSPAEGKILKILVQEGEVAKVGQAIAIIGAEGDVASTPSSSSSAPADAAPVEAVAIEENIQQATQATAPSAKIDFSGSDRFYSPLVKSIAKEEGISAVELEQISGSGN